MFAKLYETEMGQVLVKQDTNEDSKPEVRIYFQPDGLGVCSVALSFTDDDDGWDKADKAFERMDMGAAESIVKSTINQIKPE